VVQDAKSYQHLLDRLRPIREFFAEFEARHGIPR
jgi:hypothetical protein